MSLTKRSDIVSISRKLLVLVAILIAISCTAGLLLSDQRAGSSSRKLVHVKFRISNSAATSVDVTSLDAAHESATGASQIPQVLHHVYLDGLDSLVEAEHIAAPYRGQRFPGYNNTVRRSCPLVHSEWEYKFWNNSQAEDLIQASYPWFLDTFQSYETNVQKGANRSNQSQVTFPLHSLTELAPQWDLQDDLPKEITSRHICPYI